MVVPGCCWMRRHPGSLCGQLANRSGQGCPVRFEYRRAIVCSRNADTFVTAPHRSQMGKGGDPEMVLTTPVFVPTGAAGEDLRLRAFAPSSRETSCDFPSHADAMINQPVPPQRSTENHASAPAEEASGGKLSICRSSTSNASSRERSSAMRSRRSARAEAAASS